MSTFQSKLLDNAHQILIDEVDATTTYVGDSAMGSGNDNGVWMIRKLTSTGNDLAVEYANGDAYFDKIWDNRASYTYS